MLLTKVRSSITSVYQKIKFWYALQKFNRAIKKEVDENIEWYFNKNTYNIQQEDTQQKYFAGMINLKKEVKRRAKEGSSSLEETIKKVGEGLLDLARVETEEQKRHRELMEDIFIRKGSDIKTEQDKERMIDTRISHYKKLHEFKQARELRKQITKALKEDNREQYKKLTEEWKQKYGRNKLH